MRSVRILFLTGSVFYLGHNLGALECAADPETHQRGVEHSIKKNYDSNKKKGIMASWKKWRQGRRVTYAGSRILTVAFRQVLSDHEEAYKVRLRMH